MQGIAHDTAINRFHIGRAFGYHNHIGSMALIWQVAQSSPRQEMVIGIETIVGGQ